MNDEDVERHSGATHRGMHHIGENGVRWSRVKEQTELCQEDEHPRDGERQKKHAEEKEKAEQHPYTGHPEIRARDFWAQPIANQSAQKRCRQSCEGSDASEDQTDFTEFQISGCLLDVLAVGFHFRWREYLSQSFLEFF